MGGGDSPLLSEKMGGGGGRLPMQQFGSNTRYQQLSTCIGEVNRTSREIESDRTWADLTKDRETAAW